MSKAAVTRDISKHVCIMQMYMYNIHNQHDTHFDIIKHILNSQSSSNIIKHILNNQS